MMIRARGDEVPVHRPVVVFAEGQAVCRVVVAAFGKRDEVGGVDEGDVVTGGELDAEAAGGALVIVDGEDLAAEGGAAAVFLHIVCDECGLRAESWGMREGKMREVAGDEGLAHELAVGGDGGEVLEAIGETGEDLADLIDERRGLERDAVAFILDPCLPEAFGSKIVEWVFRRVLVVVFFDQLKAIGEAVAQFLAPGNQLGRGLAFVEEIKNGEQEQRLMGPLMRTPLLHRRGADVEVVEAFDGGGEEHRRGLSVISYQGKIDPWEN